jgi:hypothetical protein
MGYPEHLYPNKTKHRQSLTAKGLLDQRLCGPSLVDSLATDEELYEHIKYFCSYPIGIEYVVVKDFLDDIVIVCKQVANEIGLHDLAIALEDKSRIPAFIDNYHTWQRRNKIDKLLYQ